MRTARDRTVRAAALLTVVFAAFTWTVTASAAGKVSHRPRILYAEPIAPQWSAPSRSADAAMRFDAFGRRFELALRPNDRLAGATGARKGRLASVPGSWVRLTRNGAALTGIIFDGREYFGIEPAQSVREFLPPDAPVPAGDNLIYRLSDLLLDREALACGLAGDDAPLTAAAAIDALVSEMSEPVAAAAIGPTRRVTLAPIADVEFSDRYGSNAATKVAERLNVVEGIFTEQVGIDIAAESPQIFTTATPPYNLTATTANALLDQVSDYRLASREDAGLTHLFSGKTLENRLVGIAWQGAVCRPREGAGLSTSAGLSDIVSALVAAHELGHNFGAPHDGETGSPCASTATTFLMAARTSGSSTFSACSLEQMARVTDEQARQYPACLTRLYDFDVGVVAPTTVSGLPDTAIEIAVTVRNYGTQTIAGVLWEFVAPAALTIASVSTGSGACVTGTSRVDCNVGDIAGESEWQATVRVLSTEQRSFSVITSATAVTDEQASNNTARLTVTVSDPSQAAASSGGGGGSADWPGLLVLVLVALLRRGRISV